MDSLRFGNSTLISVGLAIGILSQTICMTSAQTPDVIFVRSDETVDHLPSSVEKRYSPGISSVDLAGKLAIQPKLIIDGAKLFITNPIRGSVRSLAFSEVELLNGGAIVIKDTSVELLTNTISSKRGMIAAFPDQAKKVQGMAGVGQNGQSGSNAGNLTLYGKISDGDVLNIDLSGQDGQDGGDGTNGGPGAAGSRGENGVDHLFDCAHGGGNGGPGAKGGPGANGGAGGAGGRGGDLVLWGELVAQRSQINFAAPGGAGGRGGGPGHGGQGGPGGDGGHGSAHCGGGRAGPSGPAGDDGVAGPAGAAGSGGSLSAS